MLNCRHVTISLPNGFDTPKIFIDGSVERIALALTLGSAAVEYIEKNALESARDETQQEADAAVAALHGMCGCSNPPTMLLTLNHAVDTDAKACKTLSRFTSKFHSIFPF
jgi:hypothetical protein